MTDNLIRSFSIHYNNGIQDRLLIKIKIINPSNGIESRECLWLVDTWANCCVISNRLAKELWLISVWVMDVLWAVWSWKANRYTVKLKLPNNFITDTLLIADWPLEQQWFDFIIWMDVLNQWDFALTKKNWTTFISFVIPSQETIDFTDMYSQKSMLAKRFKIEEEKRKNWKNNRKKRK